MKVPAGISRFAGAFVFGLAIIFPLMNQGGVITFYEAIAGIWLLFLIPAYLLYIRLRKSVAKPQSMKTTIAIYVMGSSLYSIVEPVLAGYRLGYFMFIIPILVSLSLMMPSLYIRNRFYNANSKMDIASDSKYTGNLRKMLTGIDDNPPEVFINNMPLRVGANYVTHTDGKNKRIMIHSDAVDLFTEDELNSAILKKYYDLKNKTGLKLIYRINVLVIVFADFLIVSAILFQYITNLNVQLIIAMAMFWVTLGFIAGFPLILRRMAFGQESASDLASVKISGGFEHMKSYISKSVDNYKVSPLVVGRRYERVLKFTRKQSEKRLNALEHENIAGNT